LNALGPIEQKCMEPLAAGADGTDYSYLTLDPDWGTVRKGGPWAALDIATMGFIHNEFAEDQELTEFILRSVTLPQPTKLKVLTFHITAKLIIL
jgi:hypothetical protein